MVGEEAEAEGRAQDQETAEELAETIGGVGEPSGGAEGKGQRQREELTMPAPSANSSPTSRAMPLASSIASRPASVTAAEAHSKTCACRKLMPPGDTHELRHQRGRAAGPGTGPGW